jgi:hypothetical protein
MQWEGVVICPTGLTSRFHVPPFCEKFSLCTTGKLRISVMRKLPVVLICRRQHTLRHTPDTPHIDAVPHPQEGRFAIVTNVGCGMQWTKASSTDE